jgi:hypothetical protein
MIHVQNWKIYASHYSNDSTMLGWELKKAQVDYKKYGKNMGVPVTEDVVSQAKRPGIECKFPYLFEGTSIEDYNQAIFIKQNKNCITIREWIEREESLKNSESTVKMTLETLEDDERNDFLQCELLPGLASVDDIFATDNNESVEEVLTDVLNDLYQNTQEKGTPMKKTSLFSYQTPSTKGNELLRFKETGTFLVPLRKI